MTPNLNNHGLTPNLVQTGEDDIDAEIFAEAGLLPYEIIENKLREFLDK